LWDRVMALFHERNLAEARLADVDRNEVIGWIMGNKGGHGVPDRPARTDEAR